MQYMQNFQLELAQEMLLPEVKGQNGALTVHQLGWLEKWIGEIHGG